MTLAIVTLKIFNKNVESIVNVNIHTLKGLNMRLLRV